MRAIGGPLDGRTVPDADFDKIVVLNAGFANKFGHYQRHDGCWVWVEPLKELAAKKARKVADGR